MPAPEITDRWQKAVLWEFAGWDSHSEPLVSAPVEIEVRWETDNREVLDTQGNTIRLDAKVVLNQRVAVHSILWLGELASWVGTGSSGEDTELMRVASYAETPDIKNRHLRRTAGLQRFRDNLPTQV